jgi:hypothetical protein
MHLLHCYHSTIIAEGNVMPGENLDLASEADTTNPARSHGISKPPYIGIHFTCCDFYRRIYANASLTAYEGQCPRCGRKVRFQIGPGGTDARFFTVS